MTYLFAHYWSFASLAFVLGLFVGWATCGGAALGDWRDRWYGWGVAAFVAGLFVAVLKWLPGLAGHLLEIALLLFGAYIVGCFCGCNARVGARTAPEPAEEPLLATYRDATPAAVAPAIRPLAADGDIFSIDFSASYPGARPAALAAPRGGEADDLTRIAGLDAGTARILRDIGVHHYDQIAAWSEAEAQWVEHHLAQSGRIGREGWIGQARRLAPAAPPASATMTDAARIEAAMRRRKAMQAAAPLEDDLTLIKGIGPRTAVALDELGIKRFAAIADWPPDAIALFADILQCPGRIERELWVEQAWFLAAGVDTPHSAAVKSGAIAIDDSADEPLSEAEAQDFGRSLPKQSTRSAHEWSYGGSRPLGLARPRGGKADDLKRIKDIGRKNEERLRALGIWHFDQIAAWSPENVQWMNAYLSLSGRIDREHWVDQAWLLARGETTEFARRVAAGRAPTFGA